MFFFSLLMRISKSAKGPSILDNRDLQVGQVSREVPSILGDRCRRIHLSHLSGRVVPIVLRIKIYEIEGLCSEMDHLALCIDANSHANRSSIAFLLHISHHVPVNLAVPELQLHHHYHRHPVGHVDQFHLARLKTMDTKLIFVFWKKSSHNFFLFISRIIIFIIIVGSWKVVG